MKTLGEFELRREIGRGGMGTVYAAFQRSLLREVAVKVLGQQVSSSEQAIARFRREAQAAAKLHHPSIIPIFALGEQDNVYYYAMELVEGPGLNLVIADMRAQRGSAPVRDDPAATIPIPRSCAGPDLSTSMPRAAPNARLTAADSTVVLAHSAGFAKGPELYQRVAEQIAALADALDYAHREGVIHRDIKPHNLLFGSDGRLRISDFGLARLTEQPGVTMTGELIGSPLYMSPEQIRGDIGRIDHRTDIYSLGATLYEWLTLRPPYPGETREQVISKVLTTEPLSLRTLNAQIPADLETICLKAIERDLNRRYPSAGDLRDDLLRFLSHRPVVARREGGLSRAKKFIRRHQLASLATAATILAALLIWQLFSTKQQVKVQTVAAEQARQETERLRSTMELLPIEITGPLKLAEAARPVFSEVVGTATQVLSPTKGTPTTGPDPNAVGTPAGIVRRAVRDFYEANAPAAWHLGAAAGTGELPSGLAQALGFWGGAPEQAMPLVEACLMENPADFDARQLKAALHGRIGDYARMQSEAEELIRQQPKSASAMIWRGLAHLLQGNVPNALTDFGQGVQLSGFSTWSLSLHALALLHAQRTFEALSELDGALADDPALTVALLARALIKSSLGNQSGAIEDLSDVLENEPENADVLALRGNRYVDLNDFASAEGDYEAAMKIAGPNDSIRARWMFTRLQNRLQNQPPTPPPDPASPELPASTTTGTDRTGQVPPELKPGMESRMPADDHGDRDHGGYPHSAAARSRDLLASLSRQAFRAPFPKP